MRLGIQSVPLALTDNRHRYQLREVTSLHSDQVDYLKQSKGSLLLTPNPVSEVPHYTLRLVMHIFSVANCLSAN